MRVVAITVVGTVASSGNRGSTIRGSGSRSRTEQRQQQTEDVGADAAEVVRAAKGIFGATAQTAAITEMAKDVGITAGSIIEMRTRAGTAAITVV